MKIIYSIFFAMAVSTSAWADNQFAFDLYSHLDSKPRNIFFSPYSLSSALEMTYEGARGETEGEMGLVLHINSEDADRRSDTAAFIQQINHPNKNYELSVANALWLEKTYPFKDDYLKIVENTYFAEAQNLDFAADPQASRVTINAWVSGKTKNRINDLLPAGSIAPGTRLVITDAVYFKSNWSTPFKKQDTEPENFWLTPNQPVQTDMMELDDKSFNYTDNDQAQILELPYKGGVLSMFIVLPLSKDIQGLQKFLNEDIFKKWQDAMSEQRVDVFLPKFKFDSNYQMKDKLIEMGMKTPFDKTSADFSGMANLRPDERLYIDQVYHKAWIDTGEEGTEAAAATAVVMFSASGIPVRPLSQPKIFRADHPFIFVIQENKTGQILFMGRVSDPRKK